VAKTRGLSADHEPAAADASVASDGRQWTRPCCRYKYSSTGDALSTRATRRRMPSAFVRLDSGELGQGNDGDEEDGGQGEQQRADPASGDVAASAGRVAQQQRLHATPPRERTSSAASEGNETTPLSLSLDDSYAGSTDSRSESLSAWSPAGRVASPVVVRTGGAQRGGVCPCVDPRWWSRAMLLSGIAVTALVILDAFLIYRQQAEDERFVGSVPMWASVGFGLGLCVCCGLCVATHGGIGMVSLILRGKE
jgi:hypothetical protein